MLESSPSEGFLYCSIAPVHWLSSLLAWRTRWAFLKLKSLLRSDRQRWIGFGNFSSVELIGGDYRLRLPIGRQIIMYGCPASTGNPANFRPSPILLYSDKWERPRNESRVIEINIWCHPFYIYLNCVARIIQCLPPIWLPRLLLLSSSHSSSIFSVFVLQFRSALLSSSIIIYMLAKSLTA